MNLDDYVFSMEDYDTFKPENCFREDTEIGNRRRIVQKKLLELHKEISKKLLEGKYNICQHYNNKNITALPYINVTTPRKEGINWLGLRYGMPLSEADELGFSMHGGKNKISGFLEHQCFQINILYDGVEVALFHSNRTGTYDNAYITRHLNNNDLDVINNIKQCVSKLKYIPVQFYFGSSVFDPSIDDVNYFVDFYLDNNELGYYQKCGIKFSRLDPCLLKKNFVDICIFYIDCMYDLYLALSYKKENNTNG